MERSRPVFTIGIALSSLLALACDRAQTIEEVQAGTEVVVETRDGHLVRGQLVQVHPDAVVLTTDRSGAHARIARTAVVHVRSGEDVAKAPEPRMVTVPANTTLDLTLDTTVTSDTNRPEDPVRARLASPLVVNGVTVAPSDSLLTGVVTHVKAAGKVKGRAELDLKFDQLSIGTVTYDVNAPVHFRARATKGKDAGTIGIGAVAGALVGAVAGGGKGAAVGSAVGAGGGAAVVLVTEGEEIRLGAGRSLRVSLTDPLTIRMPATTAPS